MYGFKVKGNTFSVALFLLTDFLVTFIYTPSVCKKSRYEINPAQNPQPQMFFGYFRHHVKTTPKIPAWPLSAMISLKAKA